VIAVDSNVLARFIVGDDLGQQEIARRLIAEERVFVGWSVFVELGWVLERSARLPRAEVATAMSELLAIDTLETPDAGAMAWAVERYRRGGDWADMVHLVSARDRAAAFATFDKGVAKKAGDTPPLPVRTLR
jgi:predicted nucleic-acid-binding protein